MAVKKINPIDAALGERIRRLRAVKGWTQADLAKKIKMARTSIANIEAGRQRVSLVDLFRYAKTLEVSADSLFGAAKRAA